MSSTASDTPKEPPVDEPYDPTACPRCGGYMEQMTGYPDRYAKCTVYAVCETCNFERAIGSDGVL